MTVSVGSTAHAAADGDSGDVLGFVISRSVLDEAEVLTIAVSTQHRRNGVAAVMLDAHLAALALKRVCRLFLEVDEGNVAARALYAKFGFVEKGRREGYYRTADGGRATALILRKDII